MLFCRRMPERPNSELIDKESKRIDCTNLKRNKTIKKIETDLKNENIYEREYKNKFYT